MKYWYFFLFLSADYNMTKVHDQEFKAIWNFKREKHGQGCGDLEPWDEAYFTGFMKSSASELDLSVISLSLSISLDFVFEYVTIVAVCVNTITLCET